MPSKNRVMVNFSSRNLKEIIAEIASKNNVSMSRVIEDLVSLRLLENAHGQVVETFKAISNHAIKEQRKGWGAYRRVFDTPYLKHSIRIPLEVFDLSDTLTFIIKKDRMSALSTSEIKSEIEKEIKGKLKSMKPNDWMNGSLRPLIGSADLWLIFIKKVAVEYKCEDEDSENMKFNILYEMKDIRCIPFLFNKHDHETQIFFDAMEHLDFDSVEYRTFKSVATKGWNKNEHSHLIHINLASDSGVGGFFIGALYKKNSKKFTNKPAFERATEADDIHQVNPNLEIKIHYVPSAFEINKSKPTHEEK